MSARSRNNAFENLRRLWYGEERALSENMNWLPHPTDVSEIVSKQMKRLAGREVLCISRIRAMWPEIVGPGNAKLCTPVFLRDKVMNIEIAHPAYRMALDNPKLKALIIDRINSDLGYEACTTVIFIPAGGRRPAAAKKST